LVEKKAEEKLAKERLDRAKEVIADAFVAKGDSPAFGEAVAALIDRRGAVYKVVDKANNTVDDACLEPFVKEVKLQWFKERVMRCFPPWNLTVPQKEAVVLEIVTTHNAAEMSGGALQGLGQKVWLDALSTAIAKSQLFTCPICLEPMLQVSKEHGLVDTSKMWYAPLHKNEHWSSQPCGHACCGSCMKMWAETEINDQKVNVRCPALGCSYCLFDHDLKRIVSAEAFERYHERKGADYLKHLKASLKQDPNLTRWLKGNARPCPDCHVIVSRSEGCNVMKCVCGTVFCYACGHASCRCCKKKKGNIWNPK
jgi:hypothetical protein